MQPPRTRLIAIDIDGTLLDSRGAIPEANRQAIARAQAQGVRVVLCTGRGWIETRHVAEDLGHAGPIVLACGAHVADAATGRTLHRTALTPNLAHDVVHHFNHEHFAVLVLPDPETSDHDYMVIAGHNMTDNTRWWFSRIDARIRHENKPTPLDLQHTLRIAIVGSPEHMPPIETSIRDRFASQIEVQHFAAIKQENEVLHLLEVFASGVNKWAALQGIAANLDIPPESIAAIGDQINDLEMIRRAGCGIAMGNAAESVLRNADHVTEHQDDHGVAHAIDRLLEGIW